MTLVVGMSVAPKWFSGGDDEPDTLAALEPPRHCVASGTALVTPTHCVAEVGVILVRKACGSPRPFRPGRCQVVG